MEGLADSNADLVVIQHKSVKDHKQISGGISSDSASKGASVALAPLGTAHADPNAPTDMPFHFPPGDGWKTITVTLSW